MTTTIAYIFGITILGIYIYVSFISRTINKKRYKYRIILSSVSLLTGVLMDSINLFDKPFGMFIVFGLGPFIYILSYEIFRRLYSPWIGEFPYTPHWEKIGERPIEKGYPSGRTVTTYDYIFALTLLFIPVIIILSLLSFTK